MAADQVMLRITRTGPESFEEERLGHFRFVPFVGADFGSRSQDALKEDEPNSLS